MDSKLTIKLDKRTIEKAKEYAKENNISLSRLIENYLGRITSNSQAKQGFENDPIIKSLSGVIKPVEDNWKEGYQEHLDKKYRQ